MPQKHQIGAHVSIAGGFILAFERAFEMGATTLQFFAKSPRGAASRRVTTEEANLVRNFPHRKDLRSGVIHASYLLNFAQKMNPDHYQYRSLADDLENAEALELDGVVVHLGKTKDADLHDSIKIYATTIAHLINHSPTKKVKLLLENTAGQGSEFGYRMEEWGETLKLIREKLKDPSRIAVCLDTAHVFSGGYDLRNKNAVDETLDQFDTHLGLNNLACVHLNDSKKPLAARVDRHEDIGRGTIGEDGLSYFVQTLSKKSVPFVLETPETFTPFANQIQEVRSWIK